MDKTTLNNALKFYIDGAWVDPAIHRTADIIDPSTEQPFAQVAMGSAADIERAVAAAKVAFRSYSQTTREERLALMRRVLVAYQARYAELAATMTREMGAPAQLSLNLQTGLGTAHITKMIEVLERFEFEESRGTTRVVKEPIGVVGLITPWNWPINQITCKVMPALAAGCTMVLKPSEIAPLNAILFAEALHEAGVPKGVFNLVNGDGPSTGQVLATHPDVDMVSFTGSTRAGVMVAKVAADTVKRVHQELGGKSANILLHDCDFEHAVAQGVRRCFSNSGQSCNGPTRMLVPTERYAEVAAIAQRTAETIRVGSPTEEGVDLGPVVSQVQYEKIQSLIGAGIEEGAELLSGGLGRPAGLERGYYVQPTIFGNVRPEMTIAREEIFGPVLSILTYENEDQAIEMANDTVYGLAGYVQSGSLEHARKVAAQLRAGTIYLNYPAWDASAPFGGYKQSGNGREYGDFALNDFLEIKGIVGYGELF